MGDFDDDYQEWPLRAGSPGPRGVRLQNEALFLSSVQGGIYFCLPERVRNRFSPEDSPTRSAAESGSSFVVPYLPADSAARTPLGPGSDAGGVYFLPTRLGEDPKN